MAGVSEETLRRHATTDFIQYTLGPRIVALLGALEPAESLPDARLHLGEYVESRAWLWWGRQIGYFDDVSSTGSEREVLTLADERGIFGAARWPRWFRDFAALIVEGYTPLDEGVLRERSPESLSSFQASLLASERFEEPLVRTLQQALQDPESVLDDFAQPSGPEVFEAMRLSPTRHQNTPAACVAGFIMLLDVLDTYESIFPPSEESEDTDAAVPAGRQVIAGIAGKVLRWRLNLWDEQTSRRLRAVTTMFFNAAAEEMTLIHRQGLAWDPTVSRAYLKSILEHWRERGGPETDVSPQPLNLFDRGGGAVASTS